MLRIGVSSVAVSARGNRLWSRHHSPLRFAGVALWVLAIAPSLGCARFTSSASVTSSVSLVSSMVSSDILSSPFRSSSRSSGKQPEPEEEREEEIKVYTAMFLREGGLDRTLFFKGLARCAGNRGISDWEADRHTWIGAGRGIAAAEIDSARSVALVRSWSDGEPERVALLMMGLSGHLL